MNTHRAGWLAHVSSVVVYAVVLCGFLSLTVNAVAAAERADESLARKLAEFPGADRGQTTAITDPAIAKVFPTHRFYVLRFRQYPVAITPPGPLGSNNLFVAKPDGSVGHVGDAGALERFFQAALPPVTTADQAKDVAKAWLRLVEELHQDGFFQFSIPEDAVQAIAAPDGALSVTGRATATQPSGGPGEIVASLAFDKTGRLASASETASLKRGIRPICQATKLLDPDPIVRGMAEQALLVMGAAAKGYLDEVRAGADAKLRQAIDRIWKQIRAEGR